MMHICRGALFTQAVPPPAVLLLHLPGNYTIMDDYHLNPQLSGCRGFTFPLMSHKPGTAVGQMANDAAAQRCESQFSFYSI